MQNFYRRLLDPQAASLAEVKAAYCFLTERHLQAAWLEQRYFHALKTAEGQEIAVISPGIWNQNAGPDFLKAHLIIDGREVRGDIEIHLVSSDWYHHGHHADPRYNGVILHVVIWASASGKGIYTSSQRHVPQTFLEKAFKIPLEKLSRIIDIDLYPHKVCSGTGRCAQGVFAQLSKEAAQHFFRSAAAWRLVQKHEYISGWVEDPRLYFASGIAMAFGYKNNTEVFLRMFLYLYPLKERGESALLAIAMGAAGFFQPHWHAKWGGADSYRYLKTLYLMHAMTASDSPHFALSFQQVRPLNHPLRRLVALVKMICDPELVQYYIRMENLWTTSWRELHKAKKWRVLKEEWLRILPAYADAYWNRHFAFEENAKEEYLPLWGAPLKLEVIKNTVLPLLYQAISARGCSEEAEAFFHFYATLASAERHKLRYLQHRFFGDTAKGDILLKADLEQGAYQLHKDYCLHYESSCEGCPFVEKFISHQSQAHQQFPLQKTRAPEWG